MAYPQTKKIIIDAAMERYLQGASMPVIGKEVGRCTHTIMKWKNKFGWDVKREALNKKTNEDIEISVAERKLFMLKLLRGIQGKYAQNLKTTDINTTEALKAMEAEAKLIGIDVTKIEATVKAGLTIEDMITIAQESKEVNKDAKS